MIAAVKLRDAHATATAEHMLATAPAIGVDLWKLEHVRRRLVAHEAEREGTGNLPRRGELDALIARDLDVLCEGFKVLASTAESIPSA